LPEQGTPLISLNALMIVPTPASKRGRQHRSGWRRADMVCNASTPRKNTGCHGFHANKR
jgi:hypothetical protein